MDPPRYMLHGGVHVALCIRYVFPVTFLSLAVYFRTGGHELMLLHIDTSEQRI